MLTANAKLSTVKNKPMNKRKIEKEKQRIGKELQSLRESKGISTYKVVKDHKIRFEAIQSIERGDKNYTINNLLAYLNSIEYELEFKDKKYKIYETDDKQEIT